MRTVTLVGLFAWLAPANAAYIIESRAGGQNHDRYTDMSLGHIFWSDHSAKSTAPGLTPGIGSRTVTTHPDGGIKHAIFTPDIPDRGIYEVFATWGTGGFRRNPILYRVTHAHGITDVDVDQSATANVWVSLGQYTFNAGTSGNVDMSNLHITVGGNMYADAVKWELIELLIIPEPTTSALAAIGLAAGALSARRRARRKPSRQARSRRAEA